MYFNDNIEKAKKNYWSKYITYLIVINLFFYTAFKISNNDSKFSPYSPKITKLTIRDGKTAKIGIISDFQLDKNKVFNLNILSYKYYYHNVYTSLNYFKKNNIDIIIIAGDTTNNGEKKIIYYLKKYFIQYTTPFVDPF
jgi:hypothetical protein